MPAQSTVHLPAGPWSTVLDCLCARFPAVGRDEWTRRMAAGAVVDGEQRPIGPGDPHRAGLRVHYRREVADEPVVPFAEAVLYADEHLVVADKPPFLPVMPAGDHVDETLLGRLERRGHRGLVALHRLDRATSGLVLFSASAASRAAYHALFAERRIAKTYRCLAPALPTITFPLTRHTRLAPGEPFFRMREVDGAPNAETRIDVVSNEGALWQYALTPVTGKKHQLRVHMAALGAPILNDPYYPVLRERGDDHAHPLALLAHELAFDDPVTGEPRRFTSEQTLAGSGSAS
jgi:tRNA pseudouridine32 synthase / 23S rRNA pseudouridine746 synthase